MSCGDNGPAAATSTASVLDARPCPVIKPLYKLSHKSKEEYPTKSEPTATESRRPAAALPCAGAELQPLVGAHDRNLRLIEDALEVEIVPREEQLQIYGSPESAQAAEQLLTRLLAIIRQGRGLTESDVRYALEAVKREAGEDAEALLSDPIIVTHRGKPIRPCTAGQVEYVRAVEQYDVVFCIGPAGTGKTYLAMAMAVRAMREGKVSRIVLTRPLVEAGEELGFLPGDVMDKVDPYLRPLHDALHDIMGADRFHRHLARGTIEVVPLAYMRGRTINDAFIVLDEAQNTSPMQTKMALTRLGLGSRMIVTGDITQSDLPASAPSGIVNAMRVLEGVLGICVVRLTGNDIVRHSLVQRIVRAYDEAEKHPPPPE